jgi:hypothetical protein
LDKKCEEALLKNHPDCIVGNILSSRYLKVYLYETSNKKIEIKKNGETDIEVDLVRNLIKMHYEYITNN